MLTTIPLIRTDDDSNLTPIERTAIGCEQMNHRLDDAGNDDRSASDRSRARGLHNFERCNHHARRGIKWIYLSLSA